MEADSDFVHHVQHMNDKLMSVQIDACSGIHKAAQNNDARKFDRSAQRNLFKMWGL